VNRVKSKWESQGYVSGVVTAAVSLLSVVGYQIAPEMVDAVTGTIIGVVTLISGFLGWRGRLKATHMIE